MLVLASLLVLAVTYLTILSMNGDKAFTARPGAHLRTSTDIDTYFRPVL
jgi:hypothetical protein